ncbi:MAG: DegT/DnrJ/EryC1/StrS family aminotransferase [Flavobacteriales bacterium]
MTRPDQQAIPAGTANPVPQRPLGRIDVTRAFLPPLEAYHALMQEVWGSRQLTNNGALVQRLEKALIPYHGSPHVLFTGNGTIALQIALQALEITGEVITTPYSYVASTTAILWEHCTPVFADIDPGTFCLSPDAIEACITPRTRAILATHVYGLPCDVDRIGAIARKHGLQVIYDGAHAFGTIYRGKSLLSYGDASTCSFHATKLFHSVEGGSMATPHAPVYERMRLLRAFGHVKDEHFLPGINGKNSELHAAMGLLVLEHFAAIQERRGQQWQRYHRLLRGSNVGLATVPADTDHNHAYFPVVLKNEATLHQVLAVLAKDDIHPRRYFYPSLSTLPYLASGGSCPVAEDIARRVLCLPLFHDLPEEVIDHIAAHVLRANEP